ncbi:serine/threonine-protein kinase [Pyrobaculum neutrophilum]|uniref:non-specific serine/threonine protein kinase n=1 Tax=Pyrobaculum neutrophilum (strain DSM 2338 / JCM 9278 / NBRC 100436 / V24Sta) TaxID=444157 RepID=B1YA40_PYRNV|nr:serine/threonine-protein kinase [Pyrobaculum neutrophilum]ACB39014.1 serine/threonine protein kinase [Pyrobaculum neutrophilum V24Sta]
MLSLLWTLPAILAAVAGWRFYRHSVALLWLTAASSLAFLFPEGAALFVNSLVVAAVAARAIFDRFRKPITAVFIVAVVAKLYIFTEYYLDERLSYVYYIADGVFTGLSAFLLLAYTFKPPRVGEALWLLLPASALSSTYTLAVQPLAGAVLALADARPLYVAAAAAANLYLLFTSGDPLPALPASLLVLAYVFTHKRVTYLSPQSPVGWLHAWLGGRYKVVRLLGVGGFSYVLAVKQRGALYAAKILRYVDDYGSPLAGDENILRIFGQEMQRYLEIKSDHVVKAYEVYLPAVGYRDVAQYMRNPPYILLEYMEGGTLRDLLRARKRLSIPEAVELFRQLARGLHDIHKHSVAHLDIKPENIMFTGDRKTAKIGDMGIAKVVSGEYVRSSYMSPAYAAPEVKKGAASLASDVYSLGCVMYEALTGINPNVFVENGYRVPPPSAYNPEVPPWLDELLLKMLDVDPARRPSASELNTFLNRLSGG